MSIEDEFGIQIKFPSGGVNRRNPFIGDKMWTCYDALNVWLDDPTREQERGGSRPGITSVSTSGSGGNRVRAISNVGWKVGEVNKRGLIWVIGQSIKLMEGTNTFTLGMDIKDHGRTTITELNQKAYIAKNNSGQIIEYDPATNTGGPLIVGTNDDGDPKGEVPENCNIVCTWRGRLVAADGDDPTEIFFSRVGKPDDWDYSRTDSAAAVKLSASFAGIMAQPVRALIPNTDNCMIIGCDQQIWVLRGDPKTGGTVENLSDDIGILDSKSWCKTPDASLVIMSHDGVYWMPPGCGSPFSSVSREVLPKELQGIDRQNYAVSMCYDQPSRMIFLFTSLENRTSSSVAPDGASAMKLAPETTGSIPQAGGELITNHFAIDIRQEQHGDVTHPRSASFWPMDFASGSEPFACHARYVEGGKPHAVMGTRGGKIVAMEWGNEVDDSVDYESYLVIGPLQNQSMTNQMLKRIEVTLGKDSNPVQIDIFRCEESEDIDEFDLDNPPWKATCSHAIRNFKKEVRLSGRCFYIIIRSIDKRLWALEKMVVVFSHLGRSRKHRDATITSTGPDPIP